MEKTHTYWLYISDVPRDPPSLVLVPGKDEAAFDHCHGRFHASSVKVTRLSCIAYFNKTRDNISQQFLILQALDSSKKGLAFFLAMKLQAAVLTQEPRPSWLEQIGSFEEKNGWDLGIIYQWYRLQSYRCKNSTVTSVSHCHVEPSKHSTIDMPSPQPAPGKTRKCTL